MTERSADAVLAPSVIPEPCRLALAVRPESVAQGRRFVRGVIAGHVSDPDHAHTIVLVTSELLTNALRAAQVMVSDGRARAWKSHQRPVEVGVRATARYVHLLVTDPDPRPLTPAAAADELAETGRGLCIAGVLTTALWVACARYEKTVHGLIAAPEVTLRPAEIEALGGQR